VPTGMVSGEVILLDLQMTDYLLCPDIVFPLCPNEEKDTKRELVSLLSIRTQILWNAGPILLNSSRLIASVKVIFPNITILVVRGSMYEFGRIQFSSQ
jgi:hypothetical protein